MNVLKLSEIDKNYFDHHEIARVLGIKPESARVLANRYVKRNILIRAKRDLYILREKWHQFSREQRFEIANLLQVPSYISLLTALDYYEISSQMQQDYIESVCLKRTREFNVNNTLFNFLRLAPSLYGNFIKMDTIFIARAEKALLDAFYLMSLGRYRLDISSIDRNKLNMDLLREIANQFPVRTQNLMRRYGYFS